MSDPITKEERQAIRARYEEISSMRPVVTDAIIQKWLRGYEALVVDLEADRNRYRAIVIEEAATPGQWSKLRGKASDLEEALRGLFDLVENGKLVRNIIDDDKPGFAMRQISFVMALKKAQEALAAMAKEGK